MTTLRRRDPAELERRFDVAIVGGGVYGACLARVLARAGASVALLERDDFGGAASHNSLKIVHGGLRYLQHLDVPRIRESLRAQRAWRIAAPHLVHPLRCLIPTYGWGTRGLAALAAGVVAFDTLAATRNRGVAGCARLPRGRFGRAGALATEQPALVTDEVTGYASWYDAQLADAGRVVWECVADALAHGAVALNHVAVTGLRVAGGRVHGVQAHDRLTGREYDVEARLTVNAAGPWARALLRGLGPRAASPAGTWTRNMNVVTRRLLPGSTAIGAQSDRRSDAAFGHSRRLYFVTPWQDCSIVGTTHEPWSGDPDALTPSDADVARFLQEVNAALPAVALTPDDVRYVHVGLTPAEDGEVRAKRTRVLEHEREDGVAGLATVVGIKYTTAPVVAEALAARLFASLGRAPSRPIRFAAPLPGATRPTGVGVAADEAEWARAIYGGHADAIAAIAERLAVLPGEATFRARVLHGVRGEFAVRLRDAVFRCTDRAERGRLSRADLDWTADALAAELGWSPERRRREIEDVERLLAQRSRWGSTYAGAAVPAYRESTR